MTQKLTRETALAALDSVAVKGVKNPESLRKARLLVEAIFNDKTPAHKLRMANLRALFVGGLATSLASGTATEVFSLHDQLAQMLYERGYRTEHLILTPQEHFVKGSTPHTGLDAPYCH